jgi:hypothetical protein
MKGMINMKYDGYYKIKCNDCGFEGIVYADGDKLECFQCDSVNVEKLPEYKWTADEICNVWSEDLESDNHHSMTGFPDKLKNILQIRVKDDSIVRLVLMDMFKAGITD